MTVDNDLIERLSSETGRLLANRARARRKSALAGITQYCVTVTRDGRNTRDLMFSQPPTLDQIAKLAGTDSFVVAVTMKRKSLRDRIRPLLTAAAAE